MLEAHVNDLEISIQKIRSIGGGAAAYLKATLMDAMQLDVLPEWQAYIGLDDHSLKDLAQLGHPYSTRYGTDSFVHPDEYVHIQSGDLLHSSHIEDQGDAVVLVNTSEHYKYLRFGTSVMRMRDPGGAALRDALPKIKKRFADAVKGALIDYITH
jgi:hypothetical protein